MSSWPYPYCPHQAYNQNIQIRLSSIPYTFIPEPTIDAFSNVNVKCANLDKHNIPTLAYQKYVTLGKPCQTNFAQNYYLQAKDVQGVKFDNYIVEEQKEEMAQESAYVLADGATKEYEKFEQGRKYALQNARRRAVSTLKTHYLQKQEDKVTNMHQNSQWLKKLYRKLEEIARHIVDGEGESLQEKEKMFLLSKSSLTAGYLQKIKVRNPQIALDILEELRILLMKKKLTFERQRQEQDRNKSVSMSYTASGDFSQNTSQGSYLSEATSIAGSSVDGEEQLLTKFCDFEELAKKWGLASVEEVKQMLRLTLTRKYVAEAGRDKIKKIKEAERINDTLAKLNPELSKKLKAEKEVAKSKTKSKAKSKVKQISQRGKSNSVAVTKPANTLRELQLNKEEELAKERLIKGGQFDAVGEKFNRNRVYSAMFLKRNEQTMTEFAVKQITDISSKGQGQCETRNPFD